MEHEPSRSSWVITHEHLSYCFFSQKKPKDYPRDRVRVAGKCRARLSQREDGRGRGPAVHAPAPHARCHGLRGDRAGLRARPRAARALPPDGPRTTAGVCGGAGSVAGGALARARRGVPRPGIRWA